MFYRYYNIHINLGMLLYRYYNIHINLDMLLYRYYNIHINLGMLLYRYYHKTCDIIYHTDDDAEDVDPSAVNPFSTEATAEPLNLDDPKKTLRGWFEREGYDEPEYIVEEQSHGRHKCIVE